MLVDNNILKLDTVDMDYIKKLDRPQQPNYDVKDVIKYLKMFKGHVIIQTMFLRGDGLDNTSEHFVAPWLEAVKDIQPQQVMVIPSPVKHQTSCWKRHQRKFSMPSRTV